MYHARHGGSNAYRWTNCYGYLALADTLPRAPTNRAAQEGTAQHACMEMLLKEPDRYETPAQFLNMMIEGVQITQHHVDAMVVALREANEIMDACGDNATIWAERFYTFEQGEDHRHPIAGGSADLLCVDPRDTRASIADFKFGAIEVASGSTQNKFYFASAVRQHPAMFEGITAFHSVVIQPAFTPAKIETVYTRADIDRFTTEFDIAIRQNGRLSDQYTEGPWCAYCPAAGACPVKLGHLSTLMGRTPQADAQLADAAAWWNMYVSLSETATQVRTRLHHEMDHGRSIPGVKLVARRSEATWANPETTYNVLMEHIPHRDAVRLLTPHAAGSIMPADLLQPLVRHPPGGSTIASADDPRPSIVPAGALGAALRRLQR